MHWLHLISKLSDLFLHIYITLILNQMRHSQVWFCWLPVFEGWIQKYNPPKQYWQAGPIILYEWCYYLYVHYISVKYQLCTSLSMSVWLFTSCGHGAMLVHHQLDCLSKRLDGEAVHVGLVARPGEGPAHQTVEKIVASWNKQTLILLWCLIAQKMYMIHPARTSSANP